MKFINEWLGQFEFIDNHPLVGPFFYSTEKALRFEIGPADEAECLVGSQYLERAYQRAVELLDWVSKDYDYVAFIQARDEERDLKGNLRELRFRFDLEDFPEPETLHIIDADGWPISLNRYIFSVSNQNLKQLLREIVWADHGGMSILAASVLFLSTKDGAIFHCYDDRGVDIALLDAGQRRRLFEDKAELLFDYDMEEMKRRMGLME